MKLFNNKYIQFVLVLIVGMGIGAIFYPSKTMTKEETFKLEQKIERLQTKYGKL